jgi:hypothetical protein
MEPRDEVVVASRGRSRAEYAVACGVCGALVGFPCKTESGKRREFVHQDRRFAIFRIERQKEQCAKAEAVITQFRGSSDRETIEAMAAEILQLRLYKHRVKQCAEALASERSFTVMPSLGQIADDAAGEE